jgi:hypothetical protein
MTRRLPPLAGTYGAKSCVQSCAIGSLHRIFVRRPRASGILIRVNRWMRWRVTDAPALGEHGFEFQSKSDMTADKPVPKDTPQVMLSHREIRLAFWGSEPALPSTPSPVKGIIKRDKW